ncbi:unnamed protein product, partial [Rotaria sp. Silwood1]
MLRAQLLIQQQQSFQYNDTTFPPLSPLFTSQVVNPHVNLTTTNDQQNNKHSYASVVAQKNKINLENVEQLIMDFSNSINRQLSNISATLTS